MLLPDCRSQILQTGKPIRPLNTQSLGQVQSKPRLVSCSDMLPVSRESCLGTREQVDEVNLVLFRLRTECVHVSRQVVIMISKIWQQVICCILKRSG